MFFAVSTERTASLTGWPAPDLACAAPIATAAVIVPTQNATPLMQTSA
jgi:hypothetical protein